MSAPEHLVPADLQLLMSAQAELQAAQNVLAFVQGHITRVYNLGMGDGVEAGGRIVRKAEEPADA